MTTQDKTKIAQEKQAAYIKELRARQAALRPDISKEEAMRRRKKSLRNLKIFEIATVLILLAILMYIGHHILQSFYFEDAYEEVLGNEATFNLTLIFWGAITVQAALMIRAGFVRNATDNHISEDFHDHPFRGWRYTFFTPLLGTLILLPAITAGVFRGDSGSAAGDFFLILMMSFGAFILSALVAAFIIAPIEFIIRGMVAAVRGDRTKTSFMYVGLFIAALTAFIILGSMSVDAYSPYPAGSFQVFLALIGLPGDYDVVDEALLWVTRGVAAVIIGFLIFVIYAGKKRPAATPSK